MANEKQIEELKTKIKDLKKTGSFKDVKKLNDNLIALRNAGTLNGVYPQFRSEQAKIMYDSNLEEEEKIKLFVASMNESIKLLNQIK